MKTLKKIYNWIFKPVSGKFFLFLFVLNLISNYVVLKYDDSLFAYLGVLFLSAFFAYVESAIYCLLVNRWLKKIYSFIVVTIHNLLIVCEYFLLVNFQMSIGQDAIDILAETNPVEIDNFVQTYISPGLIIVVLLLIVLLNVVIYYVVKSLSKLVIQKVCILLAVFGLGVLCLCGYNYLKYRDGLSIPQFTTITRAGYAMYIMKNRALQIRQIEKVCKSLEAEQTTKKTPMVVVVIGESASVYHSSLYGYDKLTNPLLKQYEDEGTLFLFDNVVSLFDGTHGSMRAVFSLDSLGVDFANQPLFPACFKAVNYKTLMYDNQYFVGSGITFLTDKALSETMFDYRNTQRYQYDGELVDDIQVSDSVALYVIHLMGQHYTYSQRFPKGYVRFTPKDYNHNIEEEKRQIIADYDNATLYNDYVLDKILKLFRNYYCCLFYFSDHGEEVYELRDYMGHGNAEHSPNLNYQIRVPLMVWFSPSFYSANEELARKMREAQHYPICTDDIGHAIIDVAGINTPYFAPTRSFVNSKFNKSRHRIVLNSIDYDKEWVNKR